MKKITLTLALLMSLFVSAQDIHFTFANAQNTNDGSNDYYEVDVMIQTINTTGAFKLGSGQLYFNYSTAAFGNNVFANAAFVVSYPEPEGYICGQWIDFGAPFALYGPFTRNDNTASKVSWAFSQAYSSSTFADNNVTETPTKLCHLKFKYTNVNEDPMVTFESGGSFDDQFYTACGSASGGIVDTADCGGYPGTQLVNDTFDSTGATLSNKDFERLTGISLYPNPTKGLLYLNGDVSKLKGIDIYSMTGQYVMEVKGDFRKINIESLPSAIYFVKLFTEDTTGTVKIIKD